MTARIHALGARAASLLAGWGLVSVPIEAADVLLVADAEACATLRGLRARGTQVPGLGVDLAEVPSRPQLEPFVRATGPTLDEALEALKRLQPGAAAMRLHLAGGLADLASLRFHADAKRVVLTQREADILAYLAARQARVVSRAELQVEVWGHHKASGNTRSVDMAISRLRHKIERDPAQPAVLLTCRGGGYRLVLSDSDRVQGLWMECVRRGGQRDALAWWAGFEDEVATLDGVVAAESGDRRAAAELALAERALALGSLMEMRSHVTSALTHASHPTLRAWSSHLMGLLCLEGGEEGYEATRDNAVSAALEAVCDPYIASSVLLQAGRWMAMNSKEADQGVSLLHAAPCEERSLQILRDAFVATVQTTRGDPTGSLRGHLEQAMTALLDLGEWHGAIRVGRDLAGALRMAGRTRRATEVVERLEALESEAPHLALRILLLKERYLSAEAAGRFAETQETLEALRGILPFGRLPVDMQIHGALVAAHLGQHEASDRAADEAAAMVHDPLYTTFILQVRAMVRMDQGRAAAALAVLDGVPDGLPAPFEGQVLSLRSAAHHLRGQLDAADEASRASVVRIPPLQLGPTRSSFYTALRWTLARERDAPEAGTVGDDAVAEADASTDPHGASLRRLLQQLLDGDRAALQDATASTALPVHLRIWARTALRCIEG